MSSQFFADLDFITPSSFTKALDSLASGSSPSTQDERKRTTVTVSLPEEYRYQVHVENKGSIPASTTSQISASRVVPRSEAVAAAAENAAECSELEKLLCPELAKPKKGRPPKRPLIETPSIGHVVYPIFKVPTPVPPKRRRRANIPATVSRPPPESDED